MSDDVLALVRDPGNALELCRFTIAATPSLQTIRILELPLVLSYVLLLASSLKTGHNTSALGIHRQTSPHPRNPFSPSQDDALVLFARIYGSAFFFFFFGKRFIIRNLVVLWLSFRGNENIYWPRKQVP